ncbi:Fatty acid/sphingolipid desaturase [Perilla frutescens var. hirtella]|uniref:Fatty acid/sphingolipid desaturase n=1 Tax=Perilla frutescens var. hirtella TaxID=608512 RepID=A0AAD4J755_PERFH|nr:Fatty acid/sphingolipid desaturase [Perilla frutescens var. hirtella]
MAESKKYITSEELQTHNEAGDLWISIQGKIYDVSEWIKTHPGGDLPLLNLAGKDATDAFVAYHPGKAWNFLEQFFNGFYLQDHRVSEASKDYRKLVYEFTKMGLFEKKGHTVFATMSAIAALFALSIYGVVFCDGMLLHTVCGALMGVMWIQSGWMGHDSGHYQIMLTPNVNRFVQILSGNVLAGISIAWWKRNHNAHHIAVNSLDHDPDLQHMPFFAVSSKLFNSITSFYYGRKMQFDKASRFLISNQHWTFYPVMCFARLNLFAQSFMLLLSKTPVPNRGLELLGLLVFWIWYPLLVSCLPSWSERVLFVAASFVVTSIQHVQFCLNHFSSSVYVGKPKGNDWFEKQTNGSLDISCPSWMDWFHGGLQFQIEHHLFPRLPRGQLRSISPFVRELCKKHGLPYNCATFLGANVLTVRTLRDAAMQARDFTKPLPKNLVWEAVNTHG